MSDEMLAKVVGLISQTTRAKIDQMVIDKKVPITRLIAMAIEHEFERTAPFEYDVSIPDEEYTDMAFIDEAGLILDYMKKSSGLSLESLCLMRDDMGIPDKRVFLLAFRECVEKNFVEPYKPKQPKFTSFKYNDDTVFWRLKGSGKPEARKARLKANEYDKFQRLKKKYEGK